MREHQHVEDVPAKPFGEQSLGQVGLKSADLAAKAAERQRPHIDLQQRGLKVAAGIRDPERRVRQERQPKASPGVLHPSAYGAKGTLRNPPPVGVPVGAHHGL